LFGAVWQWSGSGTAFLLAALIAGTAVIRLLMVIRPPRTTA